MSLSSFKQPQEPLVELFAERGWAVPAFEPIDASDLPRDIAPIFDHDMSMTSRLEGLFGAPVRIEVLSLQHTETRYRRLVLLKAPGQGPPLLLGALDINLDSFSAPVRNEIEATEKPFGRILGEMRVKHDFRPIAFFSFTASHELADVLRVDKGILLYARRKLVIGEDRTLGVVTEVPARFRLP